MDTGFRTRTRRRIEHTIESLERALVLVQRAFQDATAGVAAGLDGPDLGELAGVVLAAQRVVNAASAVQAVSAMSEEQVLTTRNRTRRRSCTRMRSRAF